MSDINLQNIQQGDNQSTVVDKINYNFDQILSAGGGPQGQKGPIGEMGPVGPQGPQGVQGVQGASGTKWFVQNNTPTIGGITNNNPWTVPTLGDYWLDTNDPFLTISVLGTGGWVSAGVQLAANELFQANITHQGKGGLFINGANAVERSLILADVFSSSTFGIPSYYNPAPIFNINQEDAKLKIAINNSRSKLISFARSDYDTTSPGSGENGALNNPSIQWNGSPGDASRWNIEFNNPKGRISITSNGSLTTNSGIYLASPGKIDLNTSLESIFLTTNSATKGTFIRISNGGGFFEVNDSLTGVINTNSPSLFANSNGVGIGIGRNTGFTFKQTGDDRRRLSVLGNVSIGKAISDHTSALFLGDSNTPTDPSDYDKGVLFVKGHGMFGHFNPNTDPSTAITTTGTAESSGLYPKLFVTSTRRGPVFQTKNVTTINAISRTTIGDGISNAVTSQGPDLTQEFYVNSSYSFTATPVITYQHKISNSSNTGVTSPVFSISTYSKTGVYANNTVADYTLIETRNSNGNLRLFANGFSPSTIDSNKVVIGTRGTQGFFTVFGPNNGTGRGTITIGINSETTKGMTGLFDANVINFPSKYGGSDGHNLTVRGVQTIGTNDPYSLYAYSGVGLFHQVDTNRPVGGVSMLQIRRNLFNNTLLPNGQVFGTAASPEREYRNYPNGLEITTVKGAAGPSGTPNKSVALLVASTSNIYSGPTSGFFVSDDGKNVSIGGFIDYTVALNVVGTVNATTSVTTPTVNTTTINTTTLNASNLNVSGSISGGGSIPIGGIIAYYGTVSGLPPTFRLCDGNNGTPNLTDRFIIGGSNYSYSAGGQQSATSAVTINQGHLPKHTHSFSGGTFSTSSAGSHSHSYRMDGNGGGGSSFDPAGNVNSGYSNNSGGIEPAGDHTHTIDLSSASVGDGGFANNPLPIYKYYILAYIMRVS